MTDEEKSRKPLSKRAKAMLERMRQGHFYPWEGREPSPVMAELVRHKLVTTDMRAETFKRCWVPVGFERINVEFFPLSDSASLDVLRARRGELSDVRRHIEELIDSIDFQIEGKS